MAYTPYFTDRIVEFPGRIKLTDTSNGNEMICDVERAEGTITEPGTLLNASNMNFGTTREFIQLDTAAAAGTTDGDLYRALSALNWANDCIE